MAIVKLKVLDHAGHTLAASQAGESAALVYTGSYQPGDWIALESDSRGLFCEIQLEDSMPPAVVYLPEGGLQFYVPPADNRSNYSPKSFTGTVHLLRARAVEKETLSRRNLALNPYDRHDSRGAFPHAQANIETRNEVVFAARNAIDGVFINSSHGEWPYQSWGINRDPDAALRLDFGRPVRLDRLVFTLRADFPHDSWWNRCTVRFSDGSRLEPEFAKTGERQVFELEARTVEWLVVEKLIKDPDDPSPFPALTQLEAWGTEAP